MGLLMASHAAFHVRADAVFFCSNTANPDFKRFGDVDFYKTCDSACKCSFIELICLVRNPVDEAEQLDSSSDTTGMSSSGISLYSASYAFSKSCSQTECICNTDENWAKRTEPANNGKPLPAPIFFDLPSYSQLKEAASLVDQSASPGSSEGAVSTPITNQT